MSTLLWTNKSLRNLEKDLTEKGYKACYRVIGEMSKMLGYGLQAEKRRSRQRHPTLIAISSLST